MSVEAVQPASDGEPSDWFGWSVAVQGDVIVVAPDRNQSGASHSLTLDRPLRVGKTGDGMYYVNGTPTDCVHLALTGLFDDDPDMVVAGINHGANLGDDVIYSGTVAAAMEGRFLGLPTIAVSVVGRTLVGAKLQHFDTAARVAVETLLTTGLCMVAGEVTTELAGWRFSCWVCIGGIRSCGGHDGS